MRKIILMITLTILSLATLAESVEEVVVTGIRSSDMSLPGVIYKRTGDFLLLEVNISNDTRDEEQRKKEIYATLKNAIANAKKDSSIELSLVEEGFVIPLTLENYQIELRDGSRQDTSEANIRVKTKISDQENDPTKLLDKLKQFTSTVPVNGRTEFTAVGSVDVSVVNPNQYRQQILDLIAKDIKSVTGMLGDDYKVVIEGIDKPVEWVRSGPLQLSLYVPYSYKVIPKNINSILIQSLE
jgi:hypothetical protein